MNSIAINNFSNIQLLKNIIHTYKHDAKSSNDEQKK